jgi:hypothetical protein
VANYTNDNGETVRLSTCTDPPPLLNFVEIGEYQFEYEAYVLQNGANATFLQQALGDAIHDAVARQFLKCKYDKDDLWLIQSFPNIQVTTKACAGSPAPGNTCFVFLGNDTLWIYNKPGGRRRQLQQQMSAATELFVMRINTFILNEMEKGTFNTVDSGILKIVYGTSNATIGPEASPTTSPTPSPVAGGSGDGDDDGLSTVVVAIMCVALGAVVMLLVFVLRLVCTKSRKSKREKEEDFLERAHLETMQQVAATMEQQRSISSPAKESTTTRSYNSPSKFPGEVIIQPEQAAGPTSPIRELDDLRVGESEMPGMHRGTRVGNRTPRQKAKNMVSF